MPRNITLLAAGLLIAAGLALPTAAQAAPATPSAIAATPSATSYTYSYASTRRVGYNAVGMAVDSTTQRLYTISDLDKVTTNLELLGDRTLTVIDENTELILAQIPVAPSARTVKVDPSRHLIYVGSPSGIQVVDEATEKVVDQLSSAPVSSLSVDATTHTVYSANDLTLTVINAVTKTVTATIPLQDNAFAGPSGIAVDEVRDLIYVAEAPTQDSVEVIDGATSAHVDSIPLASTYTPYLVVNQKTGLLYVAAGGCLDVYDPTTKSVSCGPAAYVQGDNGPAVEVAVDESTNTLFQLSDNDFPSMFVTPADATSDPLRWYMHLMGDGDVRGADFDPTTGRLFVTTGESDFYLANYRGTSAVTTYSTSPLTVIPDSRIFSDQSLAPGQSLESTTGGYRLVMQTDGNAVVYSSTGRVMWTSGTSVPGSRMVMQQDGNMVVYTPADRAVFNTGTYAPYGSYLVLQPDGNLVVYESLAYQPDIPVYSGFAHQTPQPELKTPPATSDYTLTAGSTLASGASLNYFGYHAVMQGDGNFVVYNGSAAVWSSGTSVPGSTLSLQPDGNLVMYAPAGFPVWNTRTNTTGPGARLLMQPDGNLVLYSGNGSASWYRLHDTSARIAPPAPPVSQYVLAAGSSLAAGASLVYGPWRTVMQTDGNLVVYNGGSAVWWTGTSVPGSTVTLQKDGNLVVYAPTGFPVWNSRTSGTGSSSRLVMQPDGNLVLYRGDDSAAWYRLHDTGALIPPPVSP